MQRRLQRQVEEERARKGLQTGRSTSGNTERTQSGKVTWRQKASGYLSSRGLVSSRSTGGTARSMLSTSRSMMTTFRSDVATGRYNDPGVGKEMTETRALDMSGIDVADSMDDDARRRRAHAQATTTASGKTPRTGKTPRSAAKTAAALRAGIVRRTQAQGTKMTGRKSARP